MLMMLDDFEGYGSLGALWTDLKMDMTHKDDFQKIAIVGDARWERDLSNVADIVSRSEIRWFAQDDEAAAFAWVKAS